MNETRNGAPRTEAGRRFADRIAHFQILGDIGDILAIEQEAARPSEAGRIVRLDALGPVCRGSCSDLSDDHYHAAQIENQSEAARPLPEPQPTYDDDAPKAALWQLVAAVEVHLHTNHGNQHTPQAGPSMGESLRVLRDATRIGKEVLGYKANSQEIFKAARGSLAPFCSICGGTTWIDDGGTTRACPECHGTAAVLDSVRSQPPDPATAQSSKG